MNNLSIIIPSRNEMFLSKTIDDILANIEGETEVIVVLDGCWADPPIKDDPRVTIIHHSKSIGQRAACNEAARVSKAKYLMKVDAHCAFDKGFDVKMMNEMQDDWTMIPVMRNLHAFDWICPEGHTRYQGPSGVCTKCGKETVRDIKWIAKPRPESTSYCFDKEPHFQYFNEYKRTPEYQTMVKEKCYNESMSLQGSFFMATRHNYWKYQLCDEKAGSWGNQGIELACAAWLSGLRVLCNHKTWYAHLFRTQGGDFSFPYKQSERNIRKTKKYIVDKFWNKKHPKQIHPVSWLLEKFAPVKGWDEDKINKL